MSVGVRKWFGLPPDSSSISAGLSHTGLTTFAHLANALAALRRPHALARARKYTTRAKIPSSQGVAHVCVLCELCDECVLQVGGEEFEVVVELHVQHAWLGGRVVVGGLALGLQDGERAERRGQSGEGGREDEVR